MQGSSTFFYFIFFMGELLHFIYHRSCTGMLKLEACAHDDLIILLLHTFIVNLVRICPSEVLKHSLTVREHFFM